MIDSLLLHVCKGMEHLHILRLCSSPGNVLSTMVHGKLSCQLVYLLFGDNVRIHQILSWCTHGRCTTTEEAFLTSQLLQYKECNLWNMLCSCVWQQHTAALGVSLPSCLGSPLL